MPKSRIVEKNKWVEAQCKRCKAKEMLLHIKVRVIQLNDVPLWKLLEEKYVCKECKWWCERKTIEKRGGCEHCAARKDVPDRGEHGDPPVSA